MVTSARLGASDFPLSLKWKNTAPCGLLGGRYVRDNFYVDTLEVSAISGGCSTVMALCMGLDLFQTVARTPDSSRRSFRGAVTERGSTRTLRSPAFRNSRGVSFNRWRRRHDAHCTAVRSPLNRAR